MPTQRTHQTLTHENDSAFSGPTIGQPFNFYAMSSGPMIHWAIVRHPALCPGSKLFWGLLRSWAKQKGICYARIEKLADGMGVSYNTICRYKNELQNAGLLRVVERSGSTNAWILLLAPCFLQEGQFEGPHKKRNLPSVVGTPPPTTEGTYRNHLRNHLRYPTRVVSSSKDRDLKPPRKKRDDDAPPEVRSERSRRAWKTHAQAAVNEVKAEHAASDRRDLTAIIESFTGELPDAYMLETILGELEHAAITLSAFTIELSAREKRLAAPMKPPFCVFLAKQLSSGACQPVQSTIVKAAPPPNTIVSLCRFCGCSYGTGKAWFTPDGEILNTEDGLRWYEENETGSLGETSCPVCNSATRTA